MTAPTIATVFDPPLPSDPKATFNTKAFALVAALNAWSGEANAASQFISAVSSAVGLSLMLVDYKGEWSTLSGPLSMPARVTHNNEVYALRADVADVTAHVPGAAFAWVLVPLLSTLVTHGDGTVSDALDCPSFRNRLVNGNFEINQLEKSGTVVLTAGQYGHDCWKAGAGGCTYTFSTSGNITTVNILTGTLVNVIEGKFLQLGYHAVSFVGSSQWRVGAGAYLDAGEYFEVTSSANVAVEFKTGTLSLVQVRPGMTAVMPFEFRDDELRRCQRYAWKTYSQGVAPGTATTSGARGFSNTANAAYGAVGTLDFPAEMAGAPTVTFYNPSTGATGTWRSGASDYAMGNASVLPSTNSAFVGNSAAIATVGQALFGHALVEYRL